MKGVPYGFRSAFESWALNTAHYPVDTVALCLGHNVKLSFQTALQPGEKLQERASIMQGWADYVTRVELQT